MFAQAEDAKEAEGEQLLVQQSQSSPNLRLQTWVNNGAVGQEGVSPFLQKGKAASAAQGLEVGFPKASWLRSLGLTSHRSCSRAPV